MGFWEELGRFCSFYHVFVAFRFKPKQKDFDYLLKQHFLKKKSKTSVVSTKVDCKKTNSFFSIRYALVAIWFKRRLVEFFYWKKKLKLT